MTAPQPIAPFELEPSQAGRLELVLPEAPPAPVVVEPTLVPSTRRPWLRFGLRAGGPADRLVWLEAYDFVAGLFARSPLLGVGSAVVLALFVLGALGRSAASSPICAASSGRSSCA